MVLYAFLALGSLTGETGRGSKERKMSLVRGGKVCSKERVSTSVEIDLRNEGKN